MDKQNVEVKNACLARESKILMRFCHALACSETYLPKGFRNCYVISHKAPSGHARSLR